MLNGREDEAEPPQRLPSQDVMVGAAFCLEKSKVEEVAQYRTTILLGGRKY